MQSSIKLPLSSWRWRGLVMLCSAMCMMACAGTSKPLERQGHPCGFPHPDPMAAVQQLALGCDITRQVTPPSNSTALIWYIVDIRSKRLGKALARVCVSGSSLLATRGHEDVFLVSAGLLYAVNRRTGERSLVPLRAFRPGWYFSQLLGFARQPGPMQVLAIMVDGQGGKDLGLFTIHDGVVRGAPIDSREVTLDRFVFPRCARDLDQCLVRSRTSGLDIERYRGQSLAPLQGTERMRIIDAVWTASGKMATAALLTAGGCP